MKVNAAQIHTRLDQPSDDIRLYLFYGSDGAGAQALGDRLARALGPDVERIDIEPAALRSNAGLLADEAASMSLFGERRYIRVLGAGDESLAAATQLLDVERAGNPVVMIGPTLRASSKLVKLAQGMGNAIATTCYVPEGAAAARLAAAMARDQGIRLVGDAAERMWESAGGDRAILARELEKLALYLDAAPDRPKEADGTVLEAVGADMGTAEMRDAIAAIVEGDARIAGAELDALRQTGVSGIPLLRQLGRKLILLARLRAEQDAGNPIKGVMEQNRVFFREQAATERALRKWSAPGLAHAIDRAFETERDLLRSGNAGDVLADQFALAVARAAARGSRGG